MAMLLHNRYCKNPNCNGVNDFLVDAEFILTTYRRMHKAHKRAGRDKN